MTGLREQVAFAISHGNMTQNNEEETAADLIGALAMTDPLGAALWRVVGNMDAGSFRDARLLLYNRLLPMSKQPHALVWRVANLALEEWLACPCPTCKGLGYTVNRVKRRKQCVECGGSGRGRLPNDERMQRLRVGCATYSKLLAVLDAAQECLTTADRAVESQLAAQLEHKSLILGKILD